MPFKNMSYDFGKVKKGEKVSYLFEYKDGPEIVKLDKSCGCTEAKKTAEGVKVTFTGKPVPYHLAHKNSLKQKNAVYVTFEDNSQQTLFIHTESYE